MNRRSLVAVAFAAVLIGCTHSPPNYPGAGGKNLDPAAYTNSECPDLSGKYEGRGALVDGDPTAQRLGRLWRIDNAFPFQDSAQAMEVIGAARSTIPEAAEVRFVQRIADISLFYAGGQKREYKSSFLDKTRFVCTGSDGVIVWGGGGVEGRSEFGPNSSDFVVSLYLDAEGNLILERGMQVHMNLRLFHIPTGTAEYHSVYRFKRIR